MQIERMLKENFQLETPNVLNQIKAQLIFSTVEKPKRLSKKRISFSISAFASFVGLIVIIIFSQSGISLPLNKDEVEPSDDDGNYGELIPNEVVRYEIDGRAITPTDEDTESIIDIIENLEMKNSYEFKSPILDNATNQRVRILLILENKEYSVILIEGKYFLIKNENQQKTYFEIKDTSSLDSIFEQNDTK